MNNQYFSCTENKLRCCGIVIHTNRRKQLEKCTRFRKARPEKMFLTLQKHGHKIEEKYPGIYYVTEHLPFPAQVIVTQELEPEEHRSLRILSNHAKKEDVEEFLRKAEGMNNSGMSPENIASITGKELDEINAILDGKVPVLS